MAGTRALFASIGAGVALVAAAALTLLAVSAMFAFGGWNDTISPSAKQPVLVFAESSLPQRNDPATLASADATRIVAPPQARRAPRRDDARPAPVDSNAVESNEPSATSVAADVKRAPPLSGPATAPAPVTTTPPPAAPAAKKTGDHVRKAGDSLSSAVQNTGTALANATQPLAPPVSAAVQQVLNLVAEVVRRATGGLGNALDALAPKK